MGRLLLLFIALPAIELALLIQIGQRIGTGETIGLIVLTGIAGAAMARSQGLRVLSEVQERLGRGEVPADSLVDGLMILVASALLITPGVLTDVIGFLCLVPGVRRLVKRDVMRRLEKAVREQKVQVRVHRAPGARPSSDPFGSERRPVIDVTPPSGPSPRQGPPKRNGAGSQT